MIKPRHKPHSFYATKKPFKVELNRDCQITGYSVSGNPEMSASLYNPIPVSKGDVFQFVPGKGITVNGKEVPRKARPLKKVIYKVSWVATRLRVVVFRERDRIHNARRKDHGKLGKPYWVACDVRSYHIGTGSTSEEAIKILIEQCQITNESAEELRKGGHKVIRWRCLLPEREVKEMEKKARKTGFILDGVEISKS